MGIFFSCSAKFIFRNSRRQSDETCDVERRISHDECKLRKKLACLNRSCSCHHKEEFRLSIRDGVVFRENNKKGVDFHKSLVFERVSHFEGMISKSRSSPAMSQPNLEVLDEKTDEYQIELQVDVALEANGADELADDAKESVEKEIELEVNVETAGTGEFNDLTNQLADDAKEDVEKEIGLANVANVETAGIGEFNDLANQLKGDVKECILKEIQIRDKSTVEGNIVLQVDIPYEAEGLSGYINQLKKDTKQDVQEEILLPDCLPSIKNIVNELVTNEEIYVRTLEQGIKNYATPMIDSSLEYIREAGVKIFGNITSIYELHANKLLPALVSCGHDVLKISETFDTLIAKGDFYCYIPFMLNREQALSLCDSYKAFFKGLQKVVDGDKLGVGSFLLQPIQRLPRYQLLLNEMIKEFIKNRQAVDIKPYVGALCRTEKNVARMLNLFNESLSINEIDGLPIDLHSIGQFLKIGTFNMHDYTRRRRYRGKLFYFEQCLIYTESVNLRLEYRGHYPIKEFGIGGYDAYEKLRLFGGKIGEHEVDFRAEMAQLEEWYDLLHTMLIDEANHERLKLSDPGKNGQCLNVQTSCL